MTYAVHVTVGQTDKQTDRQRLCSCHLVMSSLDKEGFLTNKTAAKVDNLRMESKIKTTNAMSKLFQSSPAPIKIMKSHHPESYLSWPIVESQLEQTVHPPVLLVRTTRIPGHGDGDHGDHGGHDYNGPDGPIELKYTPKSALVGNI